MAQKSILIICWDFPPNNAIGGRRWAKIAKSLLKFDHKVSVICQRPKSLKGSAPWISNEILSKIAFFYIDPDFLVKWLNDYQSRLKFLKLRIASFLLPRLYKGTIYDKAIGIEEKFLELCSTAIRERRVDTVFVTGAPFNLMYYTAKLKSKFPHVIIVADYRDPWIHAQNYGMQNLSLSKKQQELEKQNFVFEQVDVVTAPNAFLLKEIRTAYTGTKSDIAVFKELPHAFDPDDVVAVKKTANTRFKIRILYAGTLYLGIESYLKFLNESLNYIKDHSKTLLPEIVFYTNEKNGATCFEDNQDCVTFKDQIGDGIFAEIQNSDFVIILLSEHNKNYVTSKYYEYLPYGKKYIYIGPEGYVASKTEKEGFGYSLRKQSDLYNVLTNRDPGTSSMPDISKHTFDQTVKEFLAGL